MSKRQKSRGNIRGNIKELLSVSVAIGLLIFNATVRLLYDNNFGLLKTGKGQAAHPAKMTLLPVPAPKKVRRFQMYG